MMWAMLLESSWLKREYIRKPTHLLWALLFLKTYSTEPTLASRVGGVDEQTFRKWAWFYLEGITRLKPKLVSAIAIASFCFLITLLLHLLTSLHRAVSDIDKAKKSFPR